MLEQLNTKQGTLDNIVFTLKSVFKVPENHQSLKATIRVTDNIREAFSIVHHLAEDTYSKAHTYNTPKHNQHSYDKEYQYSWDYEGPSRAHAFRTDSATHDTSTHYPKDPHLKCLAYGFGSP